MGIETVTVMFTDLVGSTALLSRLGEEQGEVLRREHFGLLREGVGRFGGREVKNLGDGLMVVFPSAADAVSAGIEVQQTVARRNRRTKREPLRVRIGISAGDVDVEDGDYFGPTVVEAARLCAAAGDGEVLTTELVRMLAGTRGGHTFTSVGALELRGLDQPVATHRIEWDAETGPGPLPLPPRLLAAQTGSFVGRRAEHARLGTAWKAVDGGSVVGIGVGVLLLAGEPGIGKTTLAARFAADVREQGAVVVYGRCDEELGLPYQPWVEALGQLVGWLPDDVLDGHLAERGDSIVRLVPALAQRLGGAVPDAGAGDDQRFVLFGCVADLLARAADERPVLLVLDDLHWADQATVQLVRHLATAGHPIRAAVLGTFRDSDVGPSHPLADVLAALHRDALVERITLGGFGDDELLALLEQIAGHEMTAEGLAVRDAVLAETSGNPFFTVEVLRHLADTGAIYQGEDGQWTSTVDIRAAGLPVSVKEVIGRRLAGLGAETERVLGLAAVIGRDFDVTLLAAVGGLSEDAVIELCDAAVAAAVLDTTDDPDRYTFAHALIARTLYDGLSPARRARAHRAVGDHLERLVGPDPGDRVAELARHWLAAATPADASRAIRYAAAAGARAFDQLAPGEALRWYDAAAELGDRYGCDDHQRAEVLLGLGDAQRMCGMAEHRETLLEAARLADRIGAVRLLADAALANSRAWASNIGGSDGERLAVIDRAIERLGDADLALRARLLALAVNERSWDGDLRSRVALAEEAVRTARRSGDTAALFHALGHCRMAILAPGTLHQQIEWSAEERRLADESGDPTFVVRAAYSRSETALNAGDLPTFRANAAAMDEAIDRVPAAFWHWLHRSLRVREAILAGDLADAEARASAAWTFGEEHGQRDAFTLFTVQLLNIRHHQGRLHELIPELEQALVDSPGLTAYRAAVAEACARGGDLRRAAELLDADRAGGFAMPEDVQWPVAHAAWAGAAVQVRDRATAAILRDRLSPHPDLLVTTSVSLQCGVAHYLGLLDHLLGRHDEAHAWFEHAMAFHRGLESPLLVAYTDAAWAALLADRDRGDDRRRARQMAERAAQVAGAGGYRYIEADARAVLARLS